MLVKESVLRRKMREYERDGESGRRRGRPSPLSGQAEIGTPACESEGSLIRAERDQTVIKGLTVRGEARKGRGRGGPSGKAFEVSAGYSCFQHFLLLMRCWRHKKRSEDGGRRSHCWAFERLGSSL